MNVDFDGKSYSFDWKHIRVEDEDPRTVCTTSIAGVEGQQCFATAAYCHPQDQFNKDTGRKISLTRALREISDDLLRYGTRAEALRKAKEFRRAVWMVYWSRLPENRRPRSTRRLRARTGGGKEK